METTHKRKRGGGVFVRTAIAAALATGAPFGIALAQGDSATQNAADDSIEVTGSRIKRGNIEGPLPVTVYSREDIDITGDLTVTDFLRNLPQNTFGSFIPESISGRGGQTLATVSLRGLGSGRTLILVDGRRMPGASQSAGQSQNLNSIPMAAVERIEILREGASAIYGADAIGGVINVITRRDYEGLEFSGQLERPSRDGGDGAAASMAMGISSSKGSLFLSAEHFQRAQILAKDRDFLFNQNPSSLGFPPTFQRRTTDGDVPANPDNEPAANCPDGGFDSDPNFPNSNRQEVPGVAGLTCAFRFASFGGESPKQSRDSFSVFGTYNLTENITSFTRASASRIEGFNQLAPAPAVFANAVSGSNPNNPTRGERGDTNGDGVVNQEDEGYDLNVRFRFVPLGNRESFDTDHIFGFVTGLNGRFDFLGDSEWEVAVSHNRSRSDGELRNVILISELFAAIDEGAFDFFAPSPDVLDRVRATGYGTTKFQSRGVDGRVALGGIPFGAFNLPVVVGAEYREDEYSNISDPQSSAGNIAGSSGGAGADAKRNYTGLYVETLLPLMDNRLELGAALRRDDYNDIGSEVSPKFSVSFRPIDAVLLRASYSEGFAVPDLGTLFTSPAQSFEGAIDSLRCAESGGSFCQSAQFETRIGGNPDLEAETSENFSAGVIWNVSDNLSVGVDYYNIKLDNGIKFLEIQDLLDNERACAAGNACDQSLVSAIQRFPNGDIELILTSSFNFAKIETDGFDLDITYQQDTGVGQFGFQLLATYVNSFKEQISPTGDLFERVDTLVADVGSGAVYADYRLNSNVTWRWQDINAALGFNYLPGVKDCTAQQRDDAELRDLCSKGFGSFSTIDAQVGYSAPWGTELIVGVRNLTDKDPPISQQSGSYIKEASDLIGRTPYLRIKQTF